MNVQNGVLENDSVSCSCQAWQARGLTPVSRCLLGLKSGTALTVSAE